MNSPLRLMVALASMCVASSAWSADMTNEDIVKLEQGRLDELKAHFTPAALSVLEGADIDKLVAHLFDGEQHIANGIAALIKNGDKKDADRLDAQLKSFHRSVSTMPHAENACRSSEECMQARRSCNDVAMNLAAAGRTRKAIDDEKNNPSGVVNLVDLHGLGDSLRIELQNVEDAKREYAEKVHRPLTAAVCSRPIVQAFIKAQD